MQIKIFKIDAFTETLFGGNPAAVCPLYEWLPDNLLQKISAENNLSETAFFVPENNAIHIRWFTPVTEVDLCGHATLASAFVLFNLLGYAQNEIKFNSRSGILLVSKDEDLLTLNFPADVLKETSDYRELAMRALDTPILDYYKGRSDYLAVIDSEEKLIRLRPDFSLISQMPARGLIVTAKGTMVDFVSRCFYPQSGINEDPATGSAHTTLPVYWAPRLNKTIFTAAQLSSRTGMFICSLNGDRVLISGKAVKYLEGIIEI
jgi:PhzF family phenazine biosynthesis protein